MSLVAANGLIHHVQTLGEGPSAVVFLHGLVMDNLSSWYFTAGPKVGAAHRAVMVDLRGHGKTERPRTDFHLDDFVADLAALLDALELTEPVALVGNSFGGQLAATFASRYPHRVRRVVLVDAHLGKDGWGDAMAETLSLTGEAREAAIATHFASWLGRNSRRKSNRLADSARDLVEGTTLVADLQRSPGLDDAGLTRLTMPVVALYGEASDVADEAVRLLAHAPHARVQWFPEATHSLLWERTEAVVDAIVAAVAR